MTLPAYLVVGGAGFIGSHLVARLVERAEVTVVDDLSSGRREFLAPAIATGRCELREGSVFDAELLLSAMRGKIAVFHLSANPDARRGLDQPMLDVEQGTLATHTVLDAMRRSGVKGLVLASSATVYGLARSACRESDLGALPISLYGASKLASEALVSAYVECFGIAAWIFRLGNVIGPRATHGVAFEFLSRLKQDPEQLTVLGDGSQSRPYLHVADAVEAMLFGFEHAADPLNVFNVAPPDATTVSRIAELCVAHSTNPNASILYGGGQRGWRGDIPHLRLDATALAALGFALSRGSDDAIQLGVSELSREIFG
ncbi:MAG TPA: NAD-dependent epimerase/dehydratase family protein [Polyangiaceae bacterium]|nr:NAD-dependent epimerase/dehydratase family protein [Polyangiaceae bacterium]